MTLRSRILASNLRRWGLPGRSRAMFWRRLGFEISEMQALQMDALQVKSVMWQGTECTVVRGEDAEHVSYEIWIAPDSVRLLWDALVGAGAAVVGSEALEMQRIVSGIPRYGVDIRERDLAAGDGTGARFELQQGMLRWAGDRRAHSVAGSGASEVHGICWRRRGSDGCRAPRLSRGKKKSERLPAPLPCIWQAERRRWRWDTSGAKWECRDVRLTIGSATGDRGSVAGDG